MSEIVNVPGGRLPAPPLVAKAHQPPHPLDGTWYLHVDGTTYGPYTGHEFESFVAEGRIDGGSQVMPVGMETEWRRASDDPKLSTLFRKAIQPSSPPPIKATAGATVVQVTNTISAAPVIILEEDAPFGPKSAGTALLLSLLFCGLGQIYCGRVGRGILMMIGCFMLWFVFLGWVINLWSIIDAYSTAKKMNLRYQRRLQAQIAR